MLALTMKFETLLWLVPLMFLTGLVNAWAAPRLFPTAGGIKLRAAHMLVIASAVVVPAVVIVLGEVFPSISIGRTGDAVGVLALVVISAAVTSAAVVHAVESRSSASKG